MTWIKTPRGAPLTGARRFSINASTAHRKPKTKPRIAKNEIPKKYDPLIQLMEDAADGAQTHGVAVGLQQNTEAKIRTDLEALVGRPEGPGGVPPALLGLKVLWGSAKANKSAKTALFKIACSNGRALAAACIDSLRARLGRQWNAAWQQAGFTSGSLAIDDIPFTILMELRAYFTANPTHEAPAVGIAVTAAACYAAAQAISDAKNASNQSNADAGTAQKNFYDGIAAARDRLSGLRSELAQLMPDDDPRWYAFGFSRPSDPTTPPKVEHLVVTPGAAGSGMVFADWDDAPRAENYRVVVTNTSDGTELVNRIVEESERRIDVLPPGTPISVAVSARNAGGESPLCTAVNVVVP
jgi:hypothetical protein